MLQNLYDRVYRRLYAIDDAVVVSFPKSGRTWLRVMLDHAGVLVRYTHAHGGYRHGRHFQELVVDKGKFAKRRILLMIRDPRDTAVSGYFQASKRVDVFSGDMPSFLRDPHQGIEKIVRFNLNWLAAEKDLGAFSLIRYEQLHAATEAELVRAAKFLSGKRLSDARVRKAVEFGRFDNMRKLETSDKGVARYGKALAPGDRSDPESFKTRKGVVGGWSKYFTPEDEVYATELMKHYDYEAIVADAVARLEH